MHANESFDRGRNVSTPTTPEFQMCSKATHQTLRLHIECIRTCGTLVEGAWVEVVTIATAFAQPSNNANYGQHRNTPRLRMHSHGIDTSCSAKLLNTNRKCTSPTDYFFFLAVQKQTYFVDWRIYTHFCFKACSFVREIAFNCTKKFELSW